MERRSGLWISSTPQGVWEMQRSQVTTRKSKAGLWFDGKMDQLWEGFGGGLDESGWRALSALSAADRERVLRALFDPEEGLRLNLARVPIGATDVIRDPGRDGERPASYDETAGDLTLRDFGVERDVEYVVPFVRSAIRYIPKLKLLAVPWSPPAWMKTSAGLAGGQMIWRPEILDAYAVYLARFVEEYRKLGVRIHQVHIQNRASSESGSVSCGWTGAQLRDFIRNHVGPCFARRRLGVELWMGMLDQEGYLGYAATALTDPMAREFMSGVSYQHVGSDAIAWIHKVWPDMRLMQADCEGVGGDNGWAQAQSTFGVMQGAISAGACSVLHGRLVSGNGGHALISVDEGNRTFVLNPDYYVMRHLSSCILRNAVRLGLEGEWAGHAVAFVNEDDSYVLVVRNPQDVMKRLVLNDGQRLLVLMLQPQSFNTIVL